MQLNSQYDVTPTEAYKILSRAMRHPPVNLPPDSYSLLAGSDADNLEPYKCKEIQLKFGRITLLSSLGVLFNFNGYFTSQAMSEKNGFENYTSLSPFTKPIQKNVQHKYIRIMQETNIIMEFFISKESFSNCSPSNRFIKCDNDVVIGPKQDLFIGLDFPECEEHPAVIESISFVAPQIG